MRYILTILLFSMFTLNYSQEVEKILTKRSNKITEAIDMLGYPIKVVKDKKANRLYVEHTMNNVTRFVIYKNNRHYQHGVIYTDEVLATTD